jgi:serine/threonine-protein kinase
LQVAARTSSFSFKGKGEDIADIARKLNVGAILEGSVRKDGMRIRISAQLVNAVSGFQLWSETYDRDLKHVLSLQTDIASAVTTALKATLLGAAVETEDVGGTDNPRAFDAYLRAQRQLGAVSQTERVRLRIEGFNEAIKLDPNFAKAYAGRAAWHNEEGASGPTESEVRRAYTSARADAEKAIQLAPTLGRAYGALATALSDGFGDYKGSVEAGQRAKELAPSDINVLIAYAIGASNLGRADEAIAAGQRAVMLDPLTARTYRLLARAYESGRQHAKALDAVERALRLDPTLGQAEALRCETLYHLGEVEAALKACEMAPPDWYKDQMTAIVLFALKRGEEAERFRARMWAEFGKLSSYQQATIYAQWHDLPKALDYLEMAEGVRDPGLSGLPSDALLDPLRKEPRFRAVVQRMNLPL